MKNLNAVVLFIFYFIGYGQVLSKRMRNMFLESGLPFLSPADTEITIENANKSEVVNITFCEYSREEPKLTCTEPFVPNFNFEFLRINFTGQYKKGLPPAIKVHYCALFELPVLRDLHVINATESTVRLRWRIRSKISSTDWYHRIIAFHASNASKNIDQQMLTDATVKVEYTLAGLEPDTEYKFSVDARSPVASYLPDRDESSYDRRIRNKPSDPDIICSENAMRPGNDVWSEPVSVVGRTERIPSLVGSFNLFRVLNDSRSVRLNWRPKNEETSECVVLIKKGDLHLPSERCDDEGKHKKYISNEKYEFTIQHKDEYGYIFSRQLIVVPEQEHIIAAFPFYVIHAEDSTHYKLLWQIPATSDLSNFTIFRKLKYEHYALYMWVNSSSNSIQVAAAAESDLPLCFAISANSLTSSSGLIFPRCKASHENGCTPGILSLIHHVEENTERSTRSTETTSSNFHTPEHVGKSTTESKIDNLVFIFIIGFMAFIIFITCGIIGCVYCLYKKQKQKLFQYTRKVVVEKQTPCNGNQREPLVAPLVKIEKRKVRDEGTPSSCNVPEYELPLDNKWEFPRNRLQLGKVIGRGNFGKVVVAYASSILEKDVISIVAVKMLKECHTDADLIDLVSEMEIMKMIGKHPNILNLLGCCTRSDELLVILEYAPHGNLRDFLRRHEPDTGYEKIFEDVNKTISQTTLVFFAYQIAQGMKYLASRRCVHRDLAARNILVSDNYVMKIADFGLARDINSEDYYRKKEDSPLPVRWMAPEALVHRKYTIKSDVWSFGILLWEIMTLGATPYPSIDVNYLLRQIQYGVRMEKPTHCSDEVYILMRKCWCYCPLERPQFSLIEKVLKRMLAKPSCYGKINFGIQLEITPASTDEEETN